MYTYGRRRKLPPKSTPDKAPCPTRAVSAVAAVGAAVCVLFFCLAVDGQWATVSYPTVKSEAAVATFLHEHTAFADVLGLDTYFPQQAVQVGTFTSRGEQMYRDFLAESTAEWTFGEYLRDAFRALLGIQ